MFNISIKRYLKEARAEETRKSSVDQPKVRIGSGAGNEVQLEGAGISINHAVIEKADGDTYLITDLDSTDGTYVNNKLVVGKEQLSDQDQIKIGLYSLIFTLPVSSEESANIVISEAVTADESVDQEASVKHGDIKYVSRFKLSNRIFSIASLSILGVIFMTVLSIYFFNEDDQETYSPGPLSSAHTQFNDKCGECHTAAWDTVPDNACLNCHEVNVHNKNENFTPQCVSCHVEHQGNTMLALIADRECTQCHSELVTVNFIPSSAYERHIDGFESGHPEFAVLVRTANGKGEISRVRLNDKENLRDNTPIKLNHKVHLKAGLKGSKGPENLKCESCHRVDETGEYTLPIEYERDCSRCHTLEFDIRFAELTVPHESPDEVIEFLNKTYSSYAVEKNIGDIRNWVSDRVGETSDSLFRTKCAECHILEDATQINSPPRVLSPEIPTRWFPHGNFDHELHVKNLDLKCDACHNAKGSEMTADVLMPSINACRECHSSNGGAITDCVLCHNYHERDESDGIEGTKGIDDLKDRDER